MFLSWKEPKDIDIPEEKKFKWPLTQVKLKLVNSSNVKKYVLKQSLLIRNPKFNSANFEHVEKVKKVDNELLPPTEALYLHFGHQNLFAKFVAPETDSNSKLLLDLKKSLNRDRLLLFNGMEIQVTSNRKSCQPVIIRLEALNSQMKLRTRLQDEDPDNSFQSNAESTLESVTISSQDITSTSQDTYSCDSQSSQKILKSSVVFPVRIK